MEPIGKNENSNEEKDTLDGKLSDYKQPKKAPDEDTPSILGNDPDLLYAEPEPKEGEDFLHIHKDEELLEEPGKVDDGLL